MYTMNYQNIRLWMSLEKQLPQNFDSRDMLSRAQLLETDLFLSNYLLSSQATVWPWEIRLKFGCLFSIIALSNSLWDVGSMED